MKQIHPSTNLFKTFLIAVFLMSVQLAYAGEWDSSTRTFTETSHNIKWTLPNYGEWELADTTPMPQFMKLCAKTSGIVCTMLITDAKPNEIEDMWDAADDVMLSFLQTLSKQEATFPGARYGKLSYEKCYFTMKHAIQFVLPMLLNDERTGTSEWVKFVLVGFIFPLKRGVCNVEALLPFNMFDSAELFEGTIKDIFSRVSYINASAELE